MKSTIFVLRSFVLLFSIVKEVLSMEGREPTSSNDTIIDVMKLRGHKSKAIEGSIIIPDYFDPADYQQNVTKGEAICQFNTMVAGIMHTSFGRQQMQSLFQSQDNENVYIQFYFPEPEIIEKYENEIRMSGAKNQSVVGSPDWQKTRNLYQTKIKVPKEFIFSEEVGSFPQTNPAWLNLLQQAYMTVTRNNPFLVKKSLRGCYISGYGQSSGKARFGNVPLCEFCNVFTTLYNFFPLVKNNALKTIYLPLNNPSEGMALALEKGMTKDLLTLGNVILITNGPHVVGLFFGEGKVYFYDTIGPAYKESKYFENKSLDEMSDTEFFTNLFKEIYDHSYARDISFNITFFENSLNEKDQINKEPTTIN